MQLVAAAIAFHVAMGIVWALATLTTAITGKVGRPWPAILLGAAILNMLAGIYLWHALHAGPWGTTERLLATGTFCAFIALGVQLPIVLTAPRGDARLERGALVVHRASLVLILAAAAAMLASRFA